MTNENLEKIANKTLVNGNREADNFKSRSYKKVGYIAVGVLAGALIVGGIVGGYVLIDTAKRIGEGIYVDVPARIFKSLID